MGWKDACEPRLSGGEGEHTGGRGRREKGGGGADRDLYENVFL